MGLDLREFGGQAIGARLQGRFRMAGRTASRTRQAGPAKGEESRLLADDLRDGFGAVAVETLHLALDVRCLQQPQDRDRDIREGRQHSSQRALAHAAGVLPQRDVPHVVNPVLHRPQ